MLYLLLIPSSFFQSFLLISSFWKDYYGFVSSSPGLHTSFEVLQVFWLSTFPTRFSRTSSFPFFMQPAFFIIISASWIIRVSIGPIQCRVGRNLISFMTSLWHLSHYFHDCHCSKVASSVCWYCWCGKLLLKSGWFSVLPAIAIPGLMLDPLLASIASSNHSEVVQFIIFASHACTSSHIDNPVYPYVFLVQITTIFLAPSDTFSPGWDVHYHYWESPVLQFCNYRYLLYC